MGWLADRARDRMSSFERRCSIDQGSGQAIVDRDPSQTINVGVDDLSAG
jgi:hypothetical protein